MYTCMLNKGGGTEADLTVSRLEPGAANMPLAPQSNGEPQCVLSVILLYLLLSPLLQFSLYHHIGVVYFNLNNLCICCWMYLSLHCISFWIYGSLALFNVLLCLYPSFCSYLYLFCCV